MKTSKSQTAFERARRVIPGGVDSPVRAFGAVGGEPIFLHEGRGCRVVDVDGNSYIDYVCSWGPLIAGHAHPKVVEAIRNAAGRGSSFGAPTEAETQLAERICDAMDGVEKVRFVNSGTEAAASAVRLARGASGRELIVKFAGCYHGHVDALLVAAGSGATTFGTPSSPGIPAGTTAATLLAEYNDLAGVERLFAAHGERIAAVLVEPVAGNMGVVPPAPGFLAGLRRLCDRHGALLIFDEVITGFRVARGGAQALFGVTADLTILGKIIGGGLPVGAYGGRAGIMDQIAPTGPVYQAGTLSGNPLAMAAGIATLELLAELGVYEQLEARSSVLAAGLEAAAAAAGFPTCHTRVGSMLCTFFTEGPVTDYASARRADTRAYAAFFHAMLARGVYLAPSQFETMFVSLAHEPAEIESTVAAAEAAFAEAGRRIE
jgi:glutamate-1-semialdehyde 2,1-aminomutase